MISEGDVCLPRAALRLKRPDHSAVIFRSGTPMPVSFLQPGAVPMNDRVRKPHQTPRVTARVRNQIAVEAARRMYDIGPNPGEVPIRIGDATEAEYYSAKRKAAAVLGHRVRPGDLPSDSEVREQVIVLASSRSRHRGAAVEEDEPEEGPTLEAMADHVDRFAIYKMRLQPLESVKQNPFSTPRGMRSSTACRSSSGRVRLAPTTRSSSWPRSCTTSARPSTPRTRVAAAVEALRGPVSERTLGLIGSHRDPSSSRERTPSQRGRRMRPTTPNSGTTWSCSSDLDERRQGPRRPGRHARRGPGLSPGPGARGLPRRMNPSLRGPIRPTRRRTA